jgi:hypothetical protein
MIELTEAIIEKLCSYVRLGANLDTAAQAEGISPHCLQDWIYETKREAAEPIYATFENKLRQAKAQGEILHIQRIVASGGARESQWLLERMYPEKWGQKSRQATDRDKRAKEIAAVFSPKKLESGQP